MFRASTSATTFTVGSLSSQSSGKVRVIERAEELEHIEDGERLTRWGWLMEWGEGCVRPSELEALRHHGDPACDAVVTFLKISTGQDGLQKLLNYIEATPRAEWDDCIVTFWDEINRDPLEGIAAFPSAKAKRETHVEQLNGSCEKSCNCQVPDKVYNPEAAIKRRNRFPDAVLEEGQAVFWRYSGDMFHALLHFSLAAGFASARIMSVLHETAYLTSSSRDATYRRLIETTQALVDFMSDMTPLHGKGWKSAVRVRMLHSQVRCKILANKGRLKTYDLERDGIPINQEDLLATLGAFCMAPLWCQKRLGLTLTLQEELAYIASWRHVGYYLGISPDLLRKYYSPPSHSSDPTHRFFACISFHLYAEPVTPKDPFSTPTYKILHAVADRPPENKSTLYHCELSRALMGPGLSNQLSLPRGTWRHRLDVQRHTYYSWIITRFARYYRPSWDLRRQELFRTVIVTTVAWQLGEKRSKFTWKEQGDHEKKINQLSKDIYSEEGEDSGLEFGIEVGKRLRKEASSIFLEMGFVLLGVGMLGVGVVFQSWRMLKPWF